MRPPSLTALVLTGTLIFAGCGDDVGGDGVSIQKTSENTWEIYDPEAYPNRYLDRTCQTEGREVLNVDTPGEAYDWLNVVCAPKDATTPAPSQSPDLDSYSDTP